jgi:hypothetical protein
MRPRVVPRRRVEARCRWRERRCRGGRARLPGASRPEGWTPLRVGVGTWSWWWWSYVLLVVVCFFEIRCEQWLESENRSDQRLMFKLYIPRGTKYNRVALPQPSMPVDAAQVCPTQTQPINAICGIRPLCKSFLASPEMWLKDGDKGIKPSPIDRPPASSTLQPPNGDPLMTQLTAWLTELGSLTMREAPLRRRMRNTTGAAGPRIRACQPNRATFSGDSGAVHLQASLKGSRLFHPEAFRLVTTW